MNLHHHRHHHLTVDSPLVLWLVVAFLAVLLLLAGSAH